MTQNPFVDALLKDFETVANTVFEDLQKAFDIPETAPESPEAPAEEKNDLSPASLAREAVRLLKKAEELAISDSYGSAQLVSVADRFIRLSEIALID